MPMPAHAAPSLASPELVPAPAGAASFDGMTPDTPPAAVDLPRAAHRAVDSAMMMADHYAEGAKRGVSLQFSVSGVDLSVRVEMRHDGVHTFFRTDSTELRDAIAQEWQSAMATQPQERSSRLAEPVFTHQSGASTTADSGANSYREPGRRQEQPAPAAERFVPPTARTAAAAPTPKAPAPRVVPLSTALHLHTFA